MLVSIHLGNYRLNYAWESTAMLQSTKLPKYYNALEHWDLVRLIKEVRTDDYPPIYTVSSAALLLENGKNWALMNLVNNAFYLLILLAGTYLLSSFLYDRTTGLIAVILSAVHPYIIDIFRKFSMDFGLTAIVVLSIYLLFKSEQFTNFKWSVLFAISLGLGMMIKDPFIAFLIGPIFYFGIIAIRGYINNEDGKTRIFLNMAFVLVIALIIMSPYYFNTEKIKAVLQRPVSEAVSLPSNDIKLYTFRIINGLLGIQYIPALVLGIVFIAKNKRRPAGVVVLLWTLIPVIIVLAMPHWKSIRYILPILPAFIIASSCGIRAIIQRWYGKLLFALIICLSLSITAGSYGINMGKYASLFYRNYIAGSGESITTLNDEKRNAEMLANIVKAVSSKAGKNKKEQVIFVLYSENIVYEITLLSNLFWFNDLQVKEYTDLEPHINVFSHSYNDIDNIDFLLCGTKAATGRALTFKEALKLKKPDGSPQIDEIGPETENMWNKFMRTFNNRERISSDDTNDLYLYTRRQNKH
jgi:hypothetical protein